nr:peptidoglycan glycosyltransferase [Cyclobacteriaceae bacterium]
MNDFRKEILQVVIVLVGVIFLIKLFSIQVFNKRYAEMAEGNVILRQVEYPFRGLIYDRNHKLIVYNTPEYDIEVVNKEIKNFDSLRFCEVFDMSIQQLRQKFKEMRARKEYSPFKPTLFIDQLSNEDFARVQDFMDEFPGFYIQARTTRAYVSPTMANALGYVSEINKDQLDKDKSEFYRQGDYIGQSGIESFYEQQLRGKRGVRFKLRNVKGIEKGSFKNGEYDTLSVPGQDLVTGIDIEVQRYGEYLMQGKSGSIVAIEPSTGEILTLVSGPSY